MNYLLDTHTLIWAITEKNKLSALVQQTLEDQSNSIYVSAVTFWEVSLKFSLGKLQIEGFSPEQLPAISVQTGFQLIELSANESSTYHKLAVTKHKDPFDRMLTWQAIQLDLTFITKDENISQYAGSGLKTFW